MMQSPILLCFVAIVGAVCGQQSEETENVLQTGNGLAGQKRLSPGQAATVLQHFLHGKGPAGSPSRLVPSRKEQILDTGDKRSFRNGVGRSVDAVTEGTSPEKRSFRNGVGKRTHFRLVADASLDGLSEPEAFRQFGNDVNSTPVSRDFWDEALEKDEGQCTPCGLDFRGVCVMTGVCCRPESGCVIHQDVCTDLPDHAFCASRHHDATCRTDGKCMAPGICCRAADNTCSLAPECD